MVAFKLCILGSGEASLSFILPLIPSWDSSRSPYLLEVVIIDWLSLIGELDLSIPIFLLAFGKFLSMQDLKNLSEMVAFAIKS